MLKTRILTALVFSSLLIYIISFSPITLFPALLLAVATIIVFLSGTEFIAMRWNVMDGSLATSEKPYPIPRPKHFAIGFSYAFFIISFWFSWELFKDSPQKILILPISWIFICLFISAALIYRRAADMHTASNKLLNVIAGFIYIPLPSACLVRLALIDFPEATRNASLYFCLAATFMGDTGAYFIGTRFGKHKLIPKVSPKKSVEGAIGGLFASGMTALLLNHFLHLPFPPWYAVLMGIVMGVAGQIGDLMESAFKRAGGYKDSGHFLPGHGGFLDRIDSLLMSLPVAFFFFSLWPTV